MREKATSRETTSASSTAATRCMSSAQVKQTINKLGDAETRRNALNSLKQCVEGMDSASVSRFLGQVSEAKESTRPYAISLYEDVAKVHGKLMVPHIPRVMVSVTKTLSSSGSSPQLQQACAKVISAIAKNAIDDASPNQAEEILRELCNPLLNILTGKLEPLAAGAALCLQVLVESEKWRFAPSSVVEDLCLKTTVAMAEKSTRTVAHMQLASSLASSNPSFLASYGVTLLRSAVEVLKSLATSASWQQRASAARLLTAVLPTVDRATLAEELSTTVQALDNCKHDRMLNVRFAVKEALKTAKQVISEENLRRSSDGDELLSWMIATPEPSTSSPRRTSSLGGVSSDDMMSPPGWNSRSSPKSSLRNSPVSSVIPLSPSAPSGSPRSRVGAAATAQALDELPPPPHRSPLQASRLQSRMGTSDSAVNSFHDLESSRKENLPSHDPDAKIGAMAFDSDLIPSKPASTEGAGAHNLSSTENGAGLSPEMASKEQDENFSFSPDPLRAIGNRNDLAGDFLAEEEDTFILSNCNTPKSEAGHGSEQSEMRISRESSTKDSPANGGAFRSNHGVLNGSTMKHVFELKGPSLRSSPRMKDDESVASVLSPVKSNGDVKDASNGPLGSPLRVGSPVHLTPFEIPFSPQNTKPILGAEDFLPFSTPRRLVRSLQESFASPRSSSSPTRYADNDLAKLPEEEDVGERMGTDMDLGTPTSTSTGWSVRTNPIASDESHRTESDDSDHEQGRAAWKKMVLQPSSTSPTPPAPHTPPAQETENSDIIVEFRHRLNFPSSADAPPMQQANESSQPELTFDNGGNDMRASAESSRELKSEASNEVDMKRMSLDGESAKSATGNCVDKWSCSDDQSVRSEPENGGGFACDITAKSGVAGNERTAAAVVDNVPVVNDRLRLFGVFNRRISVRRGWRDRLNCTFFSWQWCVVIVAIPFAFALTKVVFPSDPRLTGYLVPT
ncbi:unnamed protein product [Calypogeia fissa]